MRLDLEALKHFDVETVSGNTLGHVYDVEIEIEGQIVAEYKVKPTMISRTKYFVSRDQIVKFTPNKIIVDDSVVEDKKKSQNKAPAEIEQVAMVKRN